MRSEYGIEAEEKEEKPDVERKEELEKQLPTQKEVEPLLESKKDSDIQR